MERRIGTALGLGVIFVGGFMLPWIVVATLSARDHSYRAARIPHGSEREARQRGTFVARVPARVSQAAGDVPAGIALECWLEWEQRLEYEWIVRERLVITDRTYLVVRVPSAFPTILRDDVAIFAISRSGTRTDTIALHQLRSRSAK